MAGPEDRGLIRDVIPVTLEIPSDDGDVKPVNVELMVLGNQVIVLYTDEEGRENSMHLADIVDRRKLKQLIKGAQNSGPSSFGESLEDGRSFGTDCVDCSSFGTSGEEEYSSFGAAATVQGDGREGAVQQKNLRRGVESFPRSLNGQQRVEEAVKPDPDLLRKLFAELSSGGHPGIMD